MSAGRAAPSAPSRCPCWRGKPPRRTALPPAAVAKTRTCSAAKSREGEGRGPRETSLLDLGPESGNSLTMAFPQAGFSQERTARRDLGAGKPATPLAALAPTASNQSKDPCV